MLITLWGACMHHRWEFFGLALAVGLVQGGIQALSRSYYARLIPEGRSAEYFGLYNMLGKFAVIIGPALMGTVGLVTRRILRRYAPSPEALPWVADLATPHQHRFGHGALCDRRHPALSGRREPFRRMTPPSRVRARPPRPP